MSESSPERPRNPTRLPEILSDLHIELLRPICEGVDSAELRPSDPNTESSGYATIISQPDKDAPQRLVIYYHPVTVHTIGEARVFAIMLHELGHHHPEVERFQHSCLRFAKAAEGEQFLPPNLADKAKLVHTCFNILADVLLETICCRNLPAEKMMRSALSYNRAHLFFEHMDPDGTRLQAYEESDRQLFPWSEEEFRKMEAWSQLMQASLVAPFFQWPDEAWMAPSLAKRMPEVRQLFSELRSPATRGEMKGHLFLKYVGIVGDLIREEMHKLSAAGGDTTQKSGELSDRVGDTCDRADRITKPGEAEGQPSTEQKEPPPRDLTEDIGAQRKRMDDLMQSQNAEEEEYIKQKAAELGVNVKTYRLYLDICKEWEDVIKEFTRALSQFVLRDFQVEPRTGFSEGYMITPGREFETYMRIRMGEEDPDTMEGYQTFRNPRVLQLYPCIDTSGSMKHRIEETLAYYTVIAKSCFNIQQELKHNASNYNIPFSWPPPLSLEVVTFSDTPEVVVPFQETMDEKTLLKGFESIIHETSVGQGTNDSGALKFVYKEMEKNDVNALKILMMLTDGVGNHDLLEPIIRQIEEDPGIYFLVSGVGYGSGAVQKAYQDRFRPTQDFHVFAMEHETVKEALLETLGLIKQWTAEFYARNTPS